MTNLKYDDKISIYYLRDDTMNSTLRRTWAEINTDNLKYNYNKIKEYIGPDVKFLAVVKADAYGHGAIEISKIMEEVKADYLAVSSLDEARELRSAGIRLPILIFGHTPKEEVPLIIKYDITQAVTCEAKAIEYNEEAKKLNKKLKVHIKLDTGMSRLGFLCNGTHFEGCIEGIENSVKLPYLEAEGIFTHFAVSDEYGEENDNYTKKQLELFNNVVSSLKERGITFPIRHTANTGATVRFRESHMDMVRPGLLLYGYGDEAKKLGLKPVMTLKSVVNTIKVYDEGTSVSYGRIYKTDSQRRLGVLPIGYADGFFRSLSNNYSVNLSGAKAPVRGKICMDMCMIDLTDIPEAKVGDEAEIFGENNPIENMAALAHTIPYEITCALSKRVPRIFIKDGMEYARELRLMD